VVGRLDQSIGIDETHSLDYQIPVTQLKGPIIEICKQQSEIKMRKWRYASSKARLKCAVEICKQQSEIKIRHLPAIDRFIDETNTFPLKFFI